MSFIPQFSGVVIISYFPRGQIMNAEMLSNKVDVDLISDSIKYSLEVSTSYFFTSLSSYLSQ